MDPIPPTLPFHLAKAYGVRPAAKPTDRPAITVTPVAPGVDRVDGVRAPADTADLATTRKAEAIRQRLVAGVVPGGVAFENGTARATAPTPERAAAIPFYRHPADKNAAATAIDLGARLDTRG
jgi:hypothetical protein